MFATAPRGVKPTWLAISVTCLVLFAASAARAEAAPRVWAIDDGEKVKEDQTSSPLAAGNAVWSPGGPVRLFSLRNETVAFQVVVSGGDAAADGVTVELASLASADARIENAAGAIDPTRYVGRPIERFRVHFLDVARASGGKDPTESLGWAPGSGPEPGKWLGRMPDALVPVEVAPPWLPYPMRVEPRRNAIVWIDVTVPKTQPPGTYKGVVEVKGAAGPIASLPIELEIADRVLADRPVKTMLFYEPKSLARRMGDGAAAERHLWRLFHRHRISPLHGANTPDDAVRLTAVLDGSFYAADDGYEGPGEKLGDGVLGLGTYGDLGAPDEKAMKTVEAIADLLAARALLAQTDTFVYAFDEDCKSPYGAGWKDRFRRSTNPNVSRIRVGWTCDDEPSTQPVDIAIMGSFDPKTAAAAKAKGKEVWVYNGHRPQCGAFSTDAPAIEMRVNAWLLGMFDIGRWFYWESVFWYDGNKGGKGPYDPFASAETFHNKDGDYVMGEGVLLYPGKQVDRFTTHSVGFDGVVGSIRLKNWRRGIEDAGYLALARSVDPAAAEAIARRLIPAALWAVKDGDRPAWSESGARWLEARRELYHVILGRAPPSLAPPEKTETARRGLRTATFAIPIAIAIAGVLVILARRKIKAR